MVLPILPERMGPSWQIPLAYANPASQSNPATATRCAIVTLYKPASGGMTYIFSQGYDVACTQLAVPGIRYASRGLSTSYQD